jgi:hypothetical protein
VKKDTKRWWALWHRYVIDRDGPYITRLRIVQTPWFGIYLHRIHKPDQPIMHDHPWSFASLVLRGCYWERTAVGLAEAQMFALTNGEGRRLFRGKLQKRGWLSIHRMRLAEFHTITHLAGSVWTLVVVGPRRRDWGFATEHGWQQHDDYDFGQVMLSRFHQNERIMYGLD